MELSLDSICFEHVIEADKGPLKWSSAPKGDLGTYEFKYLNIGKIKIEV